VRTVTTETGKLGRNEIEELLREEFIARIGYVDRRGYPYIVPVTYAYDGISFLGYTADGAKLEAMRHHPRVCVEVDRVRDAANWESVVAIGHFAELRGESAVDAVFRIGERLRTIAIADGSSDSARRTYVERLRAPGIAYRIRIEQIHGRFARTAG